MQKIVVDCLKSLNHISRVPNLVSNFHTSDRNVQVFKFCATQKISPGGQQLLVSDVRQALQKLSTGGWHYHISLHRDNNDLDPYRQS